MWSKSHSSNGRIARIVAIAAILLAGCDLVLGIDEVSSAEGPDGGSRNERGQRIQASTGDPGDASADDGGDEPDARAD